jgi:hypothetical protein
VWKDDTSLACEAGTQRRSVVRGLAETTDEKNGLGHLSDGELLLEELSNNYEVTN